MTEETHQFHVDSVWTGTSEGDGTLRSSGGETAYGLPNDLGGKFGRTNPEELLLQSLAACYSLTLAYLAERRRLPVSRIDLSVDGDVIRQPGGTLKLTAVRITPRIETQNADESQRQAIMDAAHKAEQY